jgi:hypothetical protein
LPGVDRRTAVDCRSAVYMAVSYVQALEVEIVRIPRGR